MKFLLACSLLLPLSTLTNGRALEPRASNSSNSWAGGNLYFLHGLSDSDQDYYINTMASNGAKVVRLWGKCSSSNTPYLRMLRLLLSIL